MTAAGGQRAERRVAPHTAGSLWACGILGKVHGLQRRALPEPRARRARAASSSASASTSPTRAPVEPRPCAVTRVGGTDRRPLVLLDLAATREEAIALQGRELLAAGDELDAQPHYRVGDLLGLPVRDGLRPPGRRGARRARDARPRDPGGAGAGRRRRPHPARRRARDASRTTGCVVVDGLLDEPEG